MKYFFDIGIIKALFLRELKTRFGKNKLGYFWVIGEPMMHIIIMLIIFAYIRERLLPQLPFSLFLISGLVPYFMFRNIVMKLIDGISANKSLFAYKPVKPIHVFVTRTLLEILIYSFVFATFMFFFGWLLSFRIFPVNFLEVVISFFVLVILGFSFGLCLAILVHSVENAKIVINVLFTVLYFVSGVMYPIWIIPSQYLEFLLLNPLIHIFETFRSNYFDGYPIIDGITIFYPMILSVIFLYLGLWFYYHKRSALGASS